MMDASHNARVRLLFALRKIKRSIQVSETNEPEAVWASLKSLLDLTPKLKELSSLAPIQAKEFVFPAHLNGPWPIQFFESTVKPSVKSRGRYVVYYSFGEAPDGISKPVNSELWEIAFRFDYAGPLRSPDPKTIVVNDQLAKIDQIIETAKGPRIVYFWPDMPQEQRLIGSGGGSGCSSTILIPPESISTDIGERAIEILDGWIEFIESDLWPNFVNDPRLSLNAHSHGPGHECGCNLTKSGEVEPEIDAIDGVGADADKKKFSIAELCQIANCSSDTLRKYGKPAIDHWAGRGGKNWRCTHAEAIRVIAAVAQGSSDQFVKKQCGEWLDDNPI